MLLQCGRRAMHASANAFAGGGNALHLTSESSRQRILLVCGMAASLLYVTTDMMAAYMWADYSYAHQTVSETFAIGAPTRLMVVWRGLAYSVLVILFGWTVRRSARNRALRVAGGLLAALGIVDFAGPFTPMHLREVLAGGGGTISDIMHIGLAVVDVVLIVMIMVFGANGFGKRFRRYSIGTILVVLVFGAWAGLDGPRIQANLPTPWVGLRERISIFSFMLWQTVLASALLRTAGRGIALGATGG